LSKHVLNDLLHNWTLGPIYRYCQMYNGRWSYWKKVRF